MTKIGKREITVMLKDLAVSRPNEVNPTTAGSCKYDKGSVKGTRHCVAGQIVRDLEYKGNLDFDNTIVGVVSGAWVTDNFGAQATFQAWLKKTFTPAALNILDDAQTIADGRANADMLPAKFRKRTRGVPWKAILHGLPLTAADRNEVKDLL